MSLLSKKLRNLLRKNLELPRAIRNVCSRLLLLKILTLKNFFRILKGFSLLPRIVSNWIHLEMFKKNLIIRHLLPDRN